MEQNVLSCPSCHCTMQPSSTLADGVYSAVCTQCRHVVRFRAKVSPRAEVQFSINDQQYTVTSQYDATLTLNEYIRDVARLSGTKVMCRQGGCGCCVVMVTYMDLAQGKMVSKAINSCLCPVYSCDGWAITTTEGLGSKQRGYNSVQKCISEKNGSQCGYCTPGMVMSTYSLLHNMSHPSAQDVEDILDGNLCRCTGYRAILDAIHSLATNHNTLDIEDLSLKQKCSGTCKESCSTSCHGQVSPLMLYLRGAKWYRPNSLQQLYALLMDCGEKKLKMVVGNTSLGLTGDDSMYDMFVDTKLIKELYLVQLKEPVTFGANISLTELIRHLMVIKTQPSYQYCSNVIKHLHKIASTPVRNVGCWAGNLAIKHVWQSFPSDVFTLLETVGATLTLGSQSETVTCTPLEFLQHDLHHKVILQVSIPPLDGSTVRSFKVMPRSQNALAYVNAGFRFKLDASFRIHGAPAIVYGGISATFVHAQKTEAYLHDKVLSHPDTLKGALECLQNEISPATGIGAATYRKRLALALFYKFVLGVCGDAVSSRMKSGGLDLIRPISSGVEVYDSDKTKWPLTEPLPKLSAKQQASGEAEYISDMCARPGQLYAAFVLTDLGPATIQHIDPSAALDFPGVEYFISAKDIPDGGNNNCMPQPMAPEEVFCSSKVLYAGQALGVVLADTQARATRAASKVKVTYTKIKRPITDIHEAITQKSFYPDPGGSLTVGDPGGAMLKSDHVITGGVAMGTQYHYTMETQNCVCIPREDGLEVYPASQWVDASQSSIAQVCGLHDKDVFVSVKRLGGAYGAKISRNFQVSAACAVASYSTNRPVQLHMDLKSNMKMVGKRFPYLAKYKVGVDKSCRLQAIEVTYYCDCGCSINDQTVSTIQYFADNAYYCANWKIKVVAVKTDTPSHSYCRAPGATPAIFIMESILEKVAQQLGHNLTQIKMLNLYQNGQRTPMGVTLSACNLTELCQQLMGSCDFIQRQQNILEYNKANRWKKCGINMVPIKYPVIYIGAQYSVQLSVYNDDGTVCITHGGIEVGQGINTKVVQVCAYELSIPIDTVTVKPCNSVGAANSTSTGGSITSELVCLGVIKCCKQLQEALAPIKQKMKAPSWSQLIKKAYTEGIDLTTRYWVAPQAPMEAYQVYGVTCTEVEIDVLTGENIIRRVDMLYDLGESMNPEVDMGQAQGAFIMGLGYFLLEETKYDPNTGQNLTADTWTYHPPSSKDIPVDFRIEFLHNASNPHGILGAKVIGEPPLSMSCSALFAVQHAVQAARLDAGQTTAWNLDAPATVERVESYCGSDISQFVLQ